MCVRFTETKVDSGFRFSFNSLKAWIYFWVDSEKWIWILFVNHQEFFFLIVLWEIFLSVLLSFLYNFSIALVFITEFISRHSMDGKFTFVDQRVCGILGYSPTELLDKPCFAFLHIDELNHVKDTFEQGKSLKRIQSSIRKFRFQSVICFSNVIQS